MATVPATIPSTVDSAKGSNFLSLLLINSGLSKYPQRSLNSKSPKLSCIAKSIYLSHKKYTQKHCNHLVSCKNILFLLLNPLSQQDHVILQNISSTSAMFLTRLSHTQTYQKNFVAKHENLQHVIKNSSSKM